MTTHRGWTDVQYSKIQSWSIQETLMRIVCLPTKYFCQCKDRSAVDWYTALGERFKEQLLHTIITWWCSHLDLYATFSKPSHVHFWYWDSEKEDISHLIQTFRYKSLHWSFFTTRDDFAGTKSSISSLQVTDGNRVSLSSPSLSITWNFLR